MRTVTSGKGVGVPSNMGAANLYLRMVCKAALAKYLRGCMSITSGSCTSPCSLIVNLSRTHPFMPRSASRLGYFGGGADGLPVFNLV